MLLSKPSWWAERQTFEVSPIFSSTYPGLTSLQRRPDSYHTCYNLVGLGNVAHSHTYAQVAAAEPYASAFSWEASRAQVPSEGDPGSIFDTGAGVRALNPVYVIPYKSVREIRAWAISQPVDLGE